MTFDKRAYIQLTLPITKAVRDFEKFYPCQLSLNLK